MITEFNKYKKINEYKENPPLTEQELMEMANATEKYTGIKGVVVWLGPNPEGHWKRINVSNVPNKFDGRDCFTITIPEYKVIGKVNTKLINSKKMKEIIDFIELNKEIIIDYSDYKIETGDMLTNLKKI